MPAIPLLALRRFLVQPHSLTDYGHEQAPPHFSPSSSVSYTFLFSFYSYTLYPTERWIFLVEKRCAAEQHPFNNCIPCYLLRFSFLPPRPIDISMILIHAASEKKKRNKKLLDFFFFTFPLRVDKFLLHRIIIHSVSIVQMSDDNFSRDTLEISRKRTNQQRLLSLL